jgi:Mg2+ and Co2+ transporter CorA
MNKKQWKDEVISVKVSRSTHEALLMLQKRYAKKSMGDAIAAYLEEKEPELVKLAAEALAVREKLESIHDEGAAVQKDDTEK